MGSSGALHGHAGDQLLSGLRTLDILRLDRANAVRLGVGGRADRVNGRGHFERELQ